MTADDIRADLEAGLKQFGNYAFDDKGASEVMDRAKIVDYLKSIPAEQARDLLLELAQAPDRTHRCKRLAGELVNDLDGQPDAYWNTLMSSPVLEAMY